jgi:hypothetical protein
LSKAVAPDVLPGARSRQPTGKVNLTDPGSRQPLKTPRGYMQGYNAQVVCNEHQIVLSAEISVSSADFGLLGPMVTAAEHEFTAVGMTMAPEVVLADAGYRHGEQMDHVTGRGVQVLIPPTPRNARAPDPAGTADGYAFMRHVLDGEIAGELYRNRQVMIEPVFADTKFNRRHRPLLAPRPIGRPLRAASNHRRRQPAQAPPPPTPARHPLTGPAERATARGPFAREPRNPITAPVAAPATQRAPFDINAPTTAALRTRPPAEPSTLAQQPPCRGAAHRRPWGAARGARSRGREHRASQRARGAP